MQVRKLRGTKVDEETMRKRQIEAQMEGIVFDSIEEAKVALNEARENWEIVKSKGGELREKEIMDCHESFRMQSLHALNMLFFFCQG